MKSRVVSQLSHQNICHVFDFGKFGESQNLQYYLVMEYVRGQSLSRLENRLYSKKEKLHTGLALHIAMETLEALDYAHQSANATSGRAMKIVHRDVSPHNVMLSYEGEVKLIDFGLADSDSKVSATEPAVIMGKLAYLSPQQARGAAVDAKTDQFSVAVMLVEDALRQPLLCRAGYNLHVEFGCIRRA